MNARKTEAGNPAGATPRRPELLLRVVSSLVLAAGALLLTLAGPCPFALLVGGVAAVLCWEWARIVRPVGSFAPLALHVSALLAAAALTAAGETAIALAALAVCAVALALYPAHTSRERRWSAAGVVYFGLPVVSLVAIRNSDPYGLAAILFLFAVVWSADIAAYFTGRGIGGPKLAPAISPGKTWSGLAGGLVVPAAVGAVFALWHGGTSPLWLAVAAGLLALLSQCGDLMESFVKRRFSRKDSSHLIPGHGGFLDRVDGLIFAAVAAYGLGLLRNPANPAQALLIWP